MEKASLGFDFYKFYVASKKGIRTSFVSYVYERGRWKKVGKNVEN